jgi:hypothetical protein
LIDAIDLAQSAGADIINLSQSVRIETNPKNDETIALISKITEVVKNNIIIVASAGNNTDLMNGNLLFPSSLPGVISVASINKGYFEAYPDYSNQLSIIGPYIKYYSTFISPQSYKEDRGCSMTTAFISGIISLQISHLKEVGTSNFNNKLILDNLSKYSLSLDSIDYNNGNLFFFHTI